MHHQPEPSRRERRAARTLAQALSPWRIGLRLLSIPVFAFLVATSIYIRTSPYEPPLALAHLIARVDCDAAHSVGLAPAYRGGLGYHARNDEDGDGVACEGVGLDMAFTTSEPVQQDPARTAGGAKFVKP
jgi:hypothetical protein